MKDVTASQLAEELIMRGGDGYVYWYTPLCGTCKMTKRMLDVVQAAVPELEVFALNVNAAPQLAQQWRIESVPCLTVVREHKPVRRLYQMESVVALFEFFKSNGVEGKRE